MLETWDVVAVGLLKKFGAGTPIPAPYLEAAGVLRNAPGKGR